MEARSFSYIKGALALVAMVLVNYLLWRLFFAPSKGFFKLFTPMYGMALSAAYFFIVLLMADIFGWRNDRNSPLRGAALTAASFVLLGIMVYGFFWNFLGRFGVAYFSPQALVAAGGTGAEMWNMRENSSTAILYLLTAMIFVAVSWNVAFRNFPWTGLEPDRLRIGTSKLFAVTSVGAVLYAVFFHPHVTAMFVPKQVYAGVAPWWEQAAMTSSAYYHLAWIFATLFVLMLTEITFEGWPWNGLRSGEGLRSLAGGVFILGVSVAAGFALMFGMEAVMSYFWYEPFTGGNYLDDPRFRHLHVAEISAFLILGLVVFQVYFNNGSSRLPSWANRTLGFLLVSGMGILFWKFYYSQEMGPAYVDRVPGIGNLDATSLCWTIMSIALILVHDRFFNAMPLRGQSHEAA